MTKVLRFAPLCFGFVAIAIGCSNEPTETPCVSSVTPLATPMTAAGGARLVRVFADTGCKWTFRGDASWITVLPDEDSTGPTGNGNGTVVLTVAVNNGVRRIGTATVASQTIQVDQAGITGSLCTFRVEPVESTFTGGAAASGSFRIIPSGVQCGWTATRSAALEDTVSPTGGGAGGTTESRFGLGEATITYQVKADSPTSPWVSGNIVVRDSAQEVAATHAVRLNK